VTLEEDISALPETINEGMPGHRANTSVLHRAAKSFLARLSTLEAKIISWADIADKPSSFTPSAHGHTVSDVANLQTALDAKAPTANPTFTGTVSGVTKAHVGLSNVSNTSDAAKPVSTAQQAALDTKPTLVAGKLPTSYLEQVSIGETFTVSSQAAMLALTVNPGDVAIRSDNDSLWMLKKAPASTLGNWWDLTAALSGVAGVTSINTMTGTVTLGAADVGAAPTSRSVSSGTGLQGGGDLTTNRVLSLNTASVASLAKADSAVQGTVNGTSTATTIWRGTASQYAAIGTKDSNTVYLVTA
jgi:hypothetical protein